LLSVSTFIFISDSYRVDFVLTVDVNQVTLCKEYRDQIVNSQIGALHGSTSLAAQKLHSALIRSPQGFREIVLALRNNNHGDLADKLDPGHNIN
ncbi:hypothetical protein MAR_014874, partial [Mya arenaria]